MVTYAWNTSIQEAEAKKDYKFKDNLGYIHTSRLSYIAKAYLEKRFLKIQILEFQSKPFKMKQSKYLDTDVNEQHLNVFLPMKRLLTLYLSHMIGICVENHCLKNYINKKYTTYVMCEGTERKKKSL